MSPLPDQPPNRLRALLVGVVIAAAVLFGSVLVLVSLTLGRCDAFGGRCPSERPDLLQDDVFGLSAVGGFIVVAVPLFLSRPSGRRLALAVASGVAAALLVGLFARSFVG